MIDPQRFRETMATFPSGVVVLTAFGQDSLPRVQHAGGFTANIPAAAREQLARRMATKLSDKFDGIAWRQPKSAHGGPILEDDCAAYAVCTLRDTIEAGDHWILIGNVVEGANREGVSPMIFSRRGYFGL